MQLAGLVWEQNNLQICSARQGAADVRVLVWQAADDQPGV
jgi:hypothetical protein